MEPSQPSKSHSPLEQTVRHALTGFGFSPASIERVEPLPRRIKNTNFRIRADGRDWVVKAHEGVQVGQRLALAHALELRLADSNFPVAQLQRSEAGHTLVEGAGMHFSLHSWVDGQQIAIADRDRVLATYPDLLRHLAQALGTLHRVAGALEHSGEDPPIVSATRLLRSPRHTARRLARLRPPLSSTWHSLRIKRRKTDFDQWIIQAMPEIASYARQLARASLAPARHTDEIIISHHDINWENLIFDEEFQLLALLDFDNVMRAPRVLEVASAAVVLAGGKRSRVEAFVAAYEGVTRVQLDHDVIRLAVTMKCTQSILNSINTYLNGNVADTELLSSWCYHLYESLQELKRW